jgi:large subunit ribosomal protein L22
MVAKAQARFIRIAPRKVRQVMDLIRGQDVDNALSVLRFTPRKGAKIIEKVLNSAVANAQHNHDMNKGELFVAQGYVDEGPVLKRFRPRAQGRASRIRKRTSHITLILEERKEA